MTSRILRLAAAVAITGCGGADEAPASDSAPEAGDRPVGVAALAELWARDLPVFGVFVPDERPMDVARSPEGRLQPAEYTLEGTRPLAADPLLDFLFLNLEGAYDVGAVHTLAQAVSTDDDPPALLVRIPPLGEAGQEVTRQRVAEIVAAGADGVVFPHVRSVAEAEAAVAAMRTAGADLWTPRNAEGRHLVMIMVEDPATLELAGRLAAVDGVGILACGIGSLTRALNGDRAAAEAGNLRVLAAARDAGLPDMITAGVDDVERRIQQGFRALLMSGPEAAQAIRSGRTSSGRESVERE